MRVVLLSLAIWLGGLAAEATAQCPVPVSPYTYGANAGYVRYGAYYAPYAAPYTVYAPFNARQPSYPMLSNSGPAVRYGTQSTYFRAAPAGMFAPPGGTFFGGYDYQVTYPPSWFGGNGTWW